MKIEERPKELSREEGSIRDFTIRGLFKFGFLK
jgi:hypothetical protein